jgi:hypothetical protein
LKIEDCRLQIDGIDDWGLMIGAPTAATVSQTAATVDQTAAIVNQQSPMASICNLQSAIFNVILHCRITPFRRPSSG